MIALKSLLDRDFRNRNPIMKWQKKDKYRSIQNWHVDASGEVRNA